jgi:hypothetical protein
MKAGLPSGCAGDGEDRYWPRNNHHGGTAMARKYSRAAEKTIASVMRKEKKGTLKSGRSGKTVTSRKQAIAIGLSEARQKGEKVPKPPKK